MSRDTHYDCQDVHFNRKGEVSTKRHKPTCQTAKDHSGTTSTCNECRKQYLKAFWTPDQRDKARNRRGIKRPESNPHYDCSLPPQDHPIMRSVGRGHRAGCQVADGHLEGSSASNLCRSCARTNQKKTSRSTSLRRRHKMTVSQYDLLYEKQKGRCAICARTQEGLRLAVDHNHQTGERRGLLCRACNLGLGNFLDDPSALRRAIRYLSR